MDSLNASQTARFRRQVISCTALLLGVVAIVKLPPLMQVVGGVAALAGSIGLVSEGFGYLQRLQVTRRAEQVEARRHEKKALRREREQEARTRRNAERQTQTHAETLRRAADTQAQEQQKRNREAEVQRRQSRERAFQLEAERLFTLEASAFVEAVCAAFAGGKGTVERGMRDSEYLCRRPDGTTEALWILTENREAETADVEALEAFRRDINAAHASLISRTGFHADAVRFAAGLPLTLTDPYLVARLNTGA